MKNPLILYLLNSFAILALFSCSTQHVVEDISDKDTVIDSSWSARDLKRVAKQMEVSIANSDFIKTQEYQELKPHCMLAKTLINDTDEHINTRVIMEKIRTALIKKKLARFVDDEALNTAIEQLNLQQGDLFDNSKAAQIGKLVGAKLILRGRISNIRKRLGRNDIVFYNITVQLVDLQTLEIIWIEEAEIQRKTIKAYYR